MSRSLLRTVHAALSVTGLFTILVFFTATIVVEVSGDPVEIAWVKRSIFWGLFFLGPVMGASGATGRKLAAGSTDPVLLKKAKRVRITTANAILVLVPCAAILHWLASQGRLDALFFAVQGVEVAAGIVNVVLLSLNLRAGLGLRRARLAA